MKHKINLKNIDSPMMAYIAGYQCAINKYRFYEQYHNVESSLPDSRIVLENNFIEEDADIWYKHMSEYFNVSEAYKGSFVQHQLKNNPDYPYIHMDEGLYFEIEEDSKPLVGKFPKNYDDKLLPYILLGFYHSTCVQGNNIILSGTKEMLDSIRYVLVYQYDFSHVDFENDVERVMNTPVFMLAFSKESSEKFRQILPTGLFTNKEN